MVESETLQFDNARTLQNLYANDLKLLQALEEKLAVLAVLYYRRRTNPAFPQVPLSEIE